MSDSAIRTILEERGGRYGSFRDNATLSQSLKDAVRAMDGWDGLSAYHKEAVEVIIQKLSRVVNGDPDWNDSWIDIQGYAQLALDEIGKDDNA